MDLKQKYDSSFESIWGIKETKEGCFWEYENDPLGEIAIHYIAFNNSPQQNNVRNYILRKDYFCKNGVIRFKFMMQGSIELN